jgi:hypothetical protein
MPERKPYLLRIPSDLLDELARWAKDDLRSLNGQIEFVLREAIRRRRGMQDDPPPKESEDSEAT